LIQKDARYIFSDHGTCYACASQACPHETRSHRTSPSDRGQAGLPARFFRHETARRPADDAALIRRCALGVRFFQKPNALSRALTKASLLSEASGLE
jgi:hypothetical protein